MEGGCGVPVLHVLCVIFSRPLIISKNFFFDPEHHVKSSGYTTVPLHLTDPLQLQSLPGTQRNGITAREVAGA